MFRSPFIVFADYPFPLGDALKPVGSYGITAQSDVLTVIGNRDGAYRLRGFAMHNAQIRLKTAQWSLSLYAENLFDRYAEVGASATPAYAQSVPDASGALHYVRSFYTYVKPPRRAA